MEGFSQALQTVLGSLDVWPSVFTALPTPLIVGTVGNPGPSLSSLTTPGKTVWYQGHLRNKLCGGKPSHPPAPQPLRAPQAPLLRLAQPG